IGCAHQFAPYIRCRHQSATLHHIFPSHQVCPTECSFTSVVPIRVPLYIRYPHHSVTLHQVFPSDSPFHHIFPSECPFTSYFSSEFPFPSHLPIRVPLSTVRAHLCPLT
ncbi:unnamed protein product, partial [Staurois parvus]